MNIRGSENLENAHGYKEENKTPQKSHWKPKDHFQ